MATTRLRLGDDGAGHDGSTDQGKGHGLYEIFVNYRTCDEPFAALLVEKRLADSFGRERVFRDSRSIRLGTHFPAEISQALRECRVLIAVIGQRWLRGDRAESRRIDDQADYVRLEVAEALRRNILVVPVLVGEVDLPAAATLPADIAGLATRQYVRLRVRSADEDVSRFVSELVSLLARGGLRPPSPASPGRRRTRPPSPPSRMRLAGSNEFSGTVEARYSIFGNVYFAR